MFKKLEIENYQSHKKTTLEFVPGVNVITGLSQSGKTAIIRALNWLVTNRPLGVNYFSNFAGKKGETKVQLSFEGLPDISLKKQVRINKKGEKEAAPATYRMGEDIFKGIGKNIPDVVQEAFNLSEINLQKQLDQPYLITSAPGEAGKVINRITKLEEVDEWVSEITTKINSANKEGGVLEGQLRDKKGQLEEYKDLPDAKAKVVALDKLYQSWEKENTARILLESMAEKLTDMNGRIAETEKALEVEKHVIEAEDLLLQFEKATAEAASLDSLVEMEESIRNAQEFLESASIVDTLAELFEAHSERGKQKERLEEFVAELNTNEIEIEETEKFLLAKDAVEALSDSLVEMEGKCTQEKKLSSVADAVAEIGSVITKDKEGYLATRGEYQRMLKELKLCPYCLGDIDDCAIERIIGEL